MRLIEALDLKDARLTVTHVKYLRGYFRYRKINFVK